MRARDDLRGEVEFWSAKWKQILTATAGETYWEYRSDLQGRVEMVEMIFCPVDRATQRFLPEQRETFPTFMVVKGVQHAKDMVTSVRMTESLRATADSQAPRGAPQTERSDGDAGRRRDLDGSRDYEHRPRQDRSTGGSRSDRGVRDHTPGGASSRVSRAPSGSRGTSRGGHSSRSHRTAADSSRKEGRRHRADSRHSRDQHNSRRGRGRDADYRPRG